MAVHPPQGPVMKVPVRFRFPINQTSESSVEVIIPTGPDAPPVLNQAFINEMKLSDAEQDRVTESVIRQVAVIQ